MNKCLQCNSSISDKATYCSDRCRKAFNRKSDKQPGQIQPGQPINSNPDKQVGQDRPLTINEKQGLTKYGICHQCNERVSHLICICRKCVAEGITHKSLGLNINNCR